MKKKYKKQLEKNLARQKETVYYQMADSKNLANDMTNSQLKMEVQNIKLHFLPNKSSREYMVKRNTDSNLNDTVRSSECTQSDDMSQLHIEDSKNKPKEIEYHVQEKSTAQKALVPYDSSTVASLPLYSILTSDLRLNVLLLNFNRSCFLSTSLDECFNGVQALDKSAWCW